jgi:hypothetical protein
VRRQTLVGVLWSVLLVVGLGGCTNKFECDAETPCDFGYTCLAGFCEESACATSAQCPMEQHCDSNRKCVPGCENSGDCYPGFYCETDSGECLEEACVDSHVDCGYREYCNPATGECYDAGGDFCKPCEPEEDNCAAGNLCWAGYCAVSCDEGRECPSGFECALFVNEVGLPVGNYCITYCWLYEDYEPGSFATAPPVESPLPVAPEVDPTDLLPAPEGP